MRPRRSSVGWDGLCTSFCCSWRPRRRSEAWAPNPHRAVLTTPGRPWPPCRPILRGRSSSLAADPRWLAPPLWRRWRRPPPVSAPPPRLPQRDPRRWPQKPRSLTYRTGRPQANRRLLPLRQWLAQPGWASLGTRLGRTQCATARPLSRRLSLSPLTPQPRTAPRVSQRRRSPRSRSPRWPLPSKSRLLSSPHCSRWRNARTPRPRRRRWFPLSGHPPLARSPTLRRLPRLHRHHRPRARARLLPPR